MSDKGRQRFFELMKQDVPSGAHTEEIDKKSSIYSNLNNHTSIQTNTNSITKLRIKNHKLANQHT